MIGQLMKLLGYTDYTALTMFLFSSAALFIYVFEDSLKKLFSAFLSLFKSIFSQINNLIYQKGQYSYIENQSKPDTLSPPRYEIVNLKVDNDQRGDSSKCAPKPRRVFTNTLKHHYYEKKVKKSEPKEEKPPQYRGFFEGIVNEFASIDQNGNANNNTNKFPYRFPVHLKRIIGGLKPYVNPKREEPFW